MRHSIEIPDAIYERLPVWFRLSFLKHKKTTPRSVDEPIERLVPHLASLPSICGAGGWALRPYACLQFVRSQRAELIAQVSGSDSSHARPLVDSYHKPYSQFFILQVRSYSRLVEVRRLVSKPRCGDAYQR